MLWRNIRLGFPYLIVNTFILEQDFKMSLLTKETVGSNAEDELYPQSRPEF